MFCCTNKSLIDLKCWKMLKPVYRLLILALMIKSSSHKDATQAPGSTGKSLDLTIKDDGLVELKAGDVTLVFYMTATNTGHESYHLSVKSEKCCQKITKDDEDCESMILLGGDMGELFPQDTRNLTLIFPNLYLHDRAGECEMEISSKSGGKMTHTVKFNTTIPRSSEHRPTRLMEQYYDPEDVQTCDTIDKDPLNECRPVSCYIKYNGFRNFFNHSSQRCEQLTPCKSESKDELPDTAYVSVSNQCRKIGEKTLSKEDEESFKHGHPGPSLHQMHTYPLNVDCFKGVRDETTGWCICNEGWKSAPFDHATFNPDVQVYHMCTIWTGELTAAEARNITFYPKESNITNYVIFSTLLTVFVLLFVVIGVCLYRQRIKNKEKQLLSYQRLATDEVPLMEKDLQEDDDSKDDPE